MILRRHGRKRGVALIFTLLVLTVLIAVVASLSMTAKTDLILSQNHLDNIQNEMALASAVSVAKEILLSDQESSEFDSRSEAWAQGVADLPVGETSVSVSLADEDGKFNIHRLVFGSKKERKVAKEQFARLVEIVADRLGVHVEKTYAGEAEIIIVREEESNVLVGNIVEFLETRMEQSGVKLEDLDKGKGEELKLRPLLYDIDELLLVEGLTPEFLYGDLDNEDAPGLADCVTTWSDLAVNINTARPEVLQCLHEKIDERLANAIVDYRRETSFEKPDDLSKVDGVDKKVFSGLKDAIGVGSRFFRADLTASTGALKKKAVAVLRRPLEQEAGGVVEVDTVYWKTTY